MMMVSTWQQSSVQTCCRFLHCRALRCWASVALCRATASEYARQMSLNSEVAVVCDWPSCLSSWCLGIVWWWTVARQSCLAFMSSASLTSSMSLACLTCIVSSMSLSCLTCLVSFMSLACLTCLVSFLLSHLYCVVVWCRRALCGELCDVSDWLTWRSCR